jgi:hypothetical protein
MPDSEQEANQSRCSRGQWGQRASEPTPALVAHHNPLCERRTVKPLMVPARYNFFSSFSRSALRAAASGSRPHAGNDSTVAVKPSSPCRALVVHREAGGTRSRDSDGVWAGSNPPVVPAPTTPPIITHTGFMSANRPARSPGVAGHGLVQSAEGLLDAGVEVVRTVGAVLVCSRWLGRWLGQPCPGLVGDRAGLVALGTVEAIIRVWNRGVGHGDHPGSRSGWAARPAPRSEGTSRRRPGRPHTLSSAGSSRPAGAVTSR